MSNLTDADLYINFSVMSDTTPYTNAALTAHHLNSGALNVEVLSGVLTIHNNGIYNADIGIAATPTATTISAIAKVASPTDLQCLVIVNPSTGNGFALRGSGSLRLHTFTAWAFDSGGALTFGSTTLADGDDYQIQFDGADITALKNDVLDFTYSLSAGELTTLGANPKPWWFYNQDNVGAGGIKAVGFNYLDSSGVTVDDSPDDIRVTESRTVRITTLGASLTTGNVDVFINSDANTALTPSAVTLVSGNTYDVAFAVTDEYAGLKYSATGYPVIISTPDGDATSGNIPYLPVTGNDFVNITAGPGDFTVSLGALASGDQIEWETLGGDVDVDDECIITYTGADPDGLTFDVRAWDDTDDTWGNFATQTLTTGGGGDEDATIPIARYGIATYGLGV